MALFEVNGVKLAGMAACVPAQEIDNLQYNWVSKKDRELLVKTTGVRTKRLAPHGMTTSDLCVVAGEKLISDLKWNKNEVDLLVFISQSRDYLLPGTSHIIQHRLGLSKNLVAFDAGLGCSGFVYGLSIVMGMMASGKLNKGLLMLGDTTTFGSYRDKTTYPLFGDAGTVIAFEKSEKENKAFFNLQTDGSGYEAIIVRGGGARILPEKSLLEYKKVDKGIYRNKLQLELDGIQVFNFSLREVAPNMKKTLEFAGIDQQHIDYFVLHQANMLINETIRKLMKAEKEKWPYSLHKYGNTSSASIPMTVISELREIAQAKSLKFLFSGFGVGLSWGTCILETDNLVIPEIMEL